MHHDEIGRGWAVYDTNDEKIGDVADVGTSYLLVQKGLIFIKDVYIPMSAVSRTDASNGAVYVSTQKDSIDSMGWDAPPTDAGSYADSGRSDTGVIEDVETGERQRLALHEEELQAETRRQQAGEVQVNKRVVEENQELEVPVTHDEVQVRRVRVDRDATTSGDAFTQDADTIRVPVTAESVEVTKTPRVVEEIEISKRPVTERQTVSDTVRREEADVTKEGDVVIEDGARDLVGSGSDRMQRTNIDDVENATDERADRF
jgi:uncharacterized protein (TIGR02271 family)